MIELFRRASGSIIARIFFGFLALSFAFMWGGQDGLRMIGLSKEATVASVGGISISNRDLGLEIQRARLSMRVRTGQDISDKDIKKMGLDRHLLTKLINEALFEIEAKRLNIAVSDDFVVKMIHEQKMFQRPDGSFSKDVFMRFIRNFGFVRESEYVEYTKSEMIRTRVMSALSANSSLPMGAINPLFSWNDQVRTAQGMIINPEKMVVKKIPTEAQLREFYGKNRRTFFAPERRTFKAIVIDTKGLNIKIKEEDIQIIYDLERDKKYKGKKDVDAKKIIRAQLLHDAAQEAIITKVDKIQNEFEAGTSLRDVAKSHGAIFKEFQDVPLVDKKIKRSGMDQGMVTVAFSAEEGELSPMEEITGTGKYVFVYLEAIKDPAKLSFSNAMIDVKEAYKHDAQAVLTKELVEKIQKELDGGGNFKIVAAKNKLKLLTIKANRRKALAPTAIDLSSRGINQLFSVPLNYVTLIPYKNKEDKTLFAIAKVTNIKNGDVKKDPKGVKDFAAKLLQQAKGDVFDPYIAYLRERNAVEINKNYFPK